VSGTILASLCDQDDIGFLKEPATCLPYFSERLKALENENAKLKKLLAEQMLDAAALRELLSKKW
jgi:hypothetical protein